jgi:DNA-binding NarL/FixJ family response regulator
MDPIKILLADDHTLVRQGLKLLLDGQPGLRVIGEASDGTEALRLVEILRPDVTVLDIMMPLLNGIEVVRQIQQRGFKTRIVMLSMHANATYAVRALHSGALGYVLKDSDFREIVLAIHTVAGGKRYLSDAIANEVLQLLLDVDTVKADTFDALSAREREVLQLIAEGHTNAAIAERLVLSVRTVESHRARVMAKLHLNSQAELVRYAVQHGLVAP